MKLAKREKLFIGAAAIILGVILILSLLIFPFFENKNRLAKETETLEKIIKDMNRLGIGSQDIAEESGSLESVLSARRGETLRAIILSEAKSAGLDNNIQKIDQGEGKPDGEYIEETVDVKLDAITTEQLKKFLFNIEKPEKFIFIRGISISHKKKGEGYLTATINVMSYKKANSEQ